ncbi:MAG TPA: T9SS type A sorting domain-containing protein [Saprospiraceae bacterium]|nr:T9SS type A sorting domain-containing protein [Saprospiraceae bacterium]
MKKLSILLYALLATMAGFSQALTIDAGDVPLPATLVPFDDFILTNPPDPSIGDNQTWDYSGYFGDSVIIVNYVTETDPLFLANGVDFHVLTFKGLTSTLGYLLNSEIDFNSNGIYEVGLGINPAEYSLAAFTGNSNDSMIIPEQKHLFLTDKTIMDFPFTMGTTWGSTTRRVTDFILTVQAFGLDHAPGQHVYTNVRTDEIVGWGKMSVHTGSGPSIEYDVLMDKVHEYNVDSFYLNGSPASPILLLAFGVSQGQHTNESYFYRFNREGAGSYPYLISFFYDNDPTYTNMTDARTNLNNLTTGVKDLQSDDYATLLFPNPSNSNEINIKIIGREFGITDFAVFDLQGRIVQQGKVDNTSGDLIRLSLSNVPVNGTYVIKLKDKDGREVVSEKVNFNRQ